jgi:hypothetical protein
VNQWNSGDLRTVAGGAGWRLSIEELLNVMNHARRKGTIVTAQKLQYILDNAFGIDQIIPTSAGKLYNKNGAWGTGDGRTEQCVAYFLPQGMELAVLVNSPIGTSNFSVWADLSARPMPRGGRCWAGGGRRSSLGASGQAEAGDPGPGRRRESIASVSYVPGHPAAAPTGRSSPTCRDGGA